MVLLLSSLAVNAQSDAVKNAFAGKFPNAKSAKWQSQSDGYTVSFKDSDGKKNALFSKAGEWKQTTVSIDEDDLPAAVKKSISIQYGRFEIDIAEQLFRPGKEMAYQTFLDTDDLTMRTVWDAKGKLLESERIAED
jgi:hypothetical protein